MELPFICLASFLAAGLTLFSGFGLGTILMPVAAVFFPVPVAIALTAVVHFLNGLFKLALLWKDINWRVTAVFGLPALLAAIPGALLLDNLSHLAPLASYQVMQHEFHVLPVNLAAGILLIVFATAELLPLSLHLRRSGAALTLGGVLSGFFGGLSGHQGAFRSAFLLQAGLGKNGLVATNAAIAALIDISRLVVYAVVIQASIAVDRAGLVLIATLSAFAGVMLGSFLLKRVTLAFIRRLVAAMLYALGLSLCAGLI